ncbi:hypothetical protein GCM10010149_37020 [Nonomuraea roseoviolacea subsp. roseoviolacea]
MGAGNDGRRLTSRAAHRAMVAMLGMTPAWLWRRGIAADANPTWRWPPPRLPSPEARP